MPMMLDALAIKTRHQIFFHGWMNAVAIQLIHTGIIINLQQKFMLAYINCRPGMFEPLKGHLRGQHIIHLQNKPLRFSSNIVIICTAFNHPNLD
jgi:hypothetical protein